MAITGIPSGQRDVSQWSMLITMVPYQVSKARSQLGIPNKETRK